MYPHSKYFFLLIILFSITQVSAQLGFRVKYNLNHVVTTDKYFELSHNEVEGDYYQSGLELGVDYRLKLKNVRIEFLNEFAVGLKTQTKFAFQSDTDFSYLAYNLNTQFYVFDLKGEESGGSESTETSSFKRGFFVTVSPGLMRNKWEESTGENETQINYRMGLGVGYDIKLSDSFTLSPGLLYTVTPSLDYKPTPDIEGLTLADSQTTIQQFQAQVRLGF